MAGLFDRLQSELEEREEAQPDETDAAPSALDLLDLPAEQGRLLRLLARSGTLTLAELAEAAGASPDELTPSLEALTARGFVRVQGSGAGARYGRSLGRRRARRIPAGLWHALSDRVDRPAPAPTPEEAAGEDEERGA
jgi:hypothetical protein